MRECWLSENQRLVSQDNFGFDLAAVEAAAKKHEAIETDIFAYEERVQAVISVASELETEKYHDIDRINARRDNVLRYLRIFNFNLQYVYLFGGVGTDLKFGAEGYKIRQILSRTQLPFVKLSFFFLFFILGLVLNVAKVVTK